VKSRLRVSSPAVRAPHAAIRTSTCGSGDVSRANAVPVCHDAQLTLQSDDINNMTVKGGNWTHCQPAVNKILRVAASPTLNNKPKRQLPIVFVSDARSISTKPYRHAFEYIDQVEAVLTEQTGVKCLWVSAGIFDRGLWDGYAEVSSAHSPAGHTNHQPLSRRC
jgi:hypothetical protein